MPIRKHPESGFWWVDVRAPGGERIRRSTGTRDKKNAQEYHDKLKAELWRVRMLGEQADHIFEEAAVRFLKQCAGQRDYATKVRHVGYWREKLKGQPVRSLTADVIIEALPTHRTYDFRPTLTLTGSTKNRYLSTIRRILRLCLDWGWVSKAPLLHMFHEPEVRVRWEPEATIVALLKALRLPWMREASLFAVATGMREDEILSLSWSQVDMARCHAWVTAQGAKSKRARAVPLNSDAMALLLQRAGKHPTLVFTRPARSGGQVRQISQVDSRDLLRACQAVGIKDFHFHDLRHTWASWHVQSGTPLMVLKELGGWETIEMVQKYAHLAPTHLASHAETVTFWSQRTLETKQPPLLAAVNA
jgi:integrase